MTERGEGLLERDPVTYEVVRSNLYAICEEMKSVIVRTAFSPVLNLSSDLSCAVLDAVGGVVAQGDDIPVHLGAMPFTVKGVLQAIPTAELEPGDAVLTNDPYLGGTHLPDMTLVSPVFDDEGIVGFVASRVHWPDVGGAAPGSATVTDEILKEGLRVPPVKLVRRGVMDEALVRLILANVRVPADRRGDLAAQYAGNLRGVRRFEELIREYGGRTVRLVLQDTQRHAQILAEEGLREIPDGVYCHVEDLDGDGYEAEDPKLPLRIAVAIRKAGAEITFDFTGTSPCARGPVNAPLAVTASSVYYVVLALLDGRVPPNSGAYRPVRIVAPPATLVNATYPVPVVAANTETANRIADVLLGALAQAVPERVAAGSYGSAAVYTLGGWDPVRRRPFVHYETIGGGMGAYCGGDGLSGVRVHMGNTMNIPVEAIETAFPVRVERYELIPDSGGPGRWRGGCGARKVIRVLADHVTFSLLAERSRHPAAGIAGGGPGRLAEFSVRLPSGEVLPIPSKTVAMQLPAGSEVWLETGGGGGWGTPPSAPGLVESVAYVSGRGQDGSEPESQ